MHFLITAYDGTDDGATARRAAVRGVHFAGAEEMHRQKKLLYAAAILDEAGGMTGSIMVMDFPDEHALHREWLDNEPYVIGDVWREIKIERCAVPGFLGAGSQV